MFALHSWTNFTFALHAWAKSSFAATEKKSFDRELVVEAPRLPVFGGDLKILLLGRISCYFAFQDPAARVNFSKRARQKLIGAGL